MVIFNIILDWSIEELDIPNPVEIPQPMELPPPPQEEQQPMPEGANGGQEFGRIIGAYIAQCKLDCQHYLYVKVFCYYE